VQQVHADDAEGFLLPRVFLVQHAHVDGDFGGLLARLRLETQAQPAVAFLLPSEPVSGNGVGKDEERALAAAWLSNRCSSRLNS
jgi:hypothetical protein